MGTKKANPGELTPFAYSRTILSGERKNVRHCITPVRQIQTRDLPHLPVRGTIDSFNARVVESVDTPSSSRILPVVRLNRRIERTSGRIFFDCRFESCLSHHDEMERNAPEPSISCVIPIRDQTAHCPRAYHRTRPSTAYMTGKGGE